MPKLVVTFDSAPLREVPIGAGPINVGRALDNDLQIDNLAISDHHARISPDGERLKIEDLNSLNGVFVNGHKVNHEWLRDGDSIAIGKHVIVVDLEHNASGVDKSKPKVASPKIEETYVLDSHHPDAGILPPRDERTAEPLSGRLRTPSLLVLKGRTDQKEYLLFGKLTLIGKSPLASVKLKGWFAPRAAAQISKRKDGYYLNALSRRVVLINGRRVNSATRVNEGDFIEVAGVSLKVLYRD